MSVFRGLSILRSRDVQNSPLLNAQNDDLMVPKNNSSIISLASDTIKKYISYAETRDEINSFHPIRYIADRQRGEKKKASKRVPLITALVQNRPHSKHRGSSRTLLHHPHRPCIRPDLCVRHSLRVESIDARHPLFFFSFPTKNATYQRTRSFSLPHGSI